MSQPYDHPLLDELRRQESILQATAFLHVVADGSGLTKWIPGWHRVNLRFARRKASTTCSKMNSLATQLLPVLSAANAEEYRHVARECELANWYATALDSEPGNWLRSGDDHFAHSEIATFLMSLALACRGTPVFQDVCAIALSMAFSQYERRLNEGKSCGAYSAFISIALSRIPVERSLHRQAASIARQASAIRPKCRKRLKANASEDESSNKWRFLVDTMKRRRPDLLCLLEGVDQAGAASPEMHSA